MIKKLFSNKYFIILLIVTLFLIVTMIFSVNKSEEETSTSDNIIIKITLPVQKAVYGISSGIRNFFDHFDDIDALNKQNEKLLKRNAELNSQIEKYKNYKKENERLRNLLLLQDTYKDFETTAANVIGKDSSQWFLSLMIDKGTDDGLKMSDTVINHEGLIGHITDIGSNWARITTILDSDSNVAVIVERTEDLATINGDINLSSDSLCKMSYISKDSTITVGDIVKTSGLGGIYPKGINVGTIKDIHSDNQGVSQYADVKPSVNFDKIYEVLVITN